MTRHHEISPPSEVRAQFDGTSFQKAAAIKWANAIQDIKTDAWVGLYTQHYPTKVSIANQFKNQPKKDVAQAKNDGSEVATNQEDFNIIFQNTIRYRNGQDSGTRYPEIIGA